MEGILLQAFGMMSALSVVLAYWLVTSGRVFPTDLRYLGLNLFGSVTAIIYLVILSAWASVFVQVFWVAITAHSLWQVRQAVRRRAEEKA